MVFVRRIYQIYCSSNVITNSTSRNPYCAFVPAVRTNYGRDAISFQAIYLWNNLNSSLYQCKDLKEFKNLKCHLKKKHFEQFKELEQKEIQKKDEKIVKEKRKLSAVTAFTGKQLTIHEAVQGGRKYSVDSEKHKLINKHLAIFIGSTDVLISLVENEEFKKFTQVLDSRYEMPGRTKIGKEITTIMIELKQVISIYLQKAKLVNICADIWTKKGMTASFLGITAHFYSSKDNKRHNLTLAARRFPSPHTAANVVSLVQAVLFEWQIPD